MPLMTDLFTPAELTGYARASMADYEARKGSLARWLPNREVNDIIVRTLKGEAGLTEEASFRAYGAEPEIGRAPKLERILVELPALGQNIPLDEYSKLRARHATDDTLRNHILKRTDMVVRAVVDRIERMRGIVLATGKATVDQTNFKLEDDFGRSADMKVTASTKWSQSGAKIVEDLRAWYDKYVEVNGEEPGTLLVSQKVARALANAPEFQTKLADGATRPGTLSQVNDYLVGDGLPVVTTYTRRTKAGLVLPENTALFLPESVGTDEADETQLGATFWGESECAGKPEWEIAEDEQPGIVVAAFEGEKPGEPTEVISDAIGLPVLANANLAMAMEVL